MCMHLWACILFLCHKSCDFSYRIVGGIQTIMLFHTFPSFLYLRALNIQYLPCNIPKPLFKFRNTYVFWTEPGCIMYSFIFASITILYKPYIILMLINEHFVISWWLQCIQGINQTVNAFLLWFIIKMVSKVIVCVIFIIYYKIFFKPTYFLNTTFNTAPEKQKAFFIYG